MGRNFQAIAFTPSVRSAQRLAYGRAPELLPESAPEPLGPDEIAFIEARDSFYLATVSETGWPYVQHRGGAPGFLHVVDPTTLAFADYPGNRQLISTGNLAANPRVALFLMDYRRRERLKLLGYARIGDARDTAPTETASGVPLPRPERLFTIKIVASDWNCPKHITPRYTAEEIRDLVAPLHARIAELEARVKQHASAPLPRTSPG